MIPAGLGDNEMPNNRLFLVYPKPKWGALSRVPESLTQHQASKKTLQNQMNSD